MKKNIYTLHAIDNNNQAPVKFLSDIMENKKFNGFDTNGYLPKGVYHMPLEEFEEIFSNSKRRKEILEIYKGHLNDLKNSGYFLDHWIDGSFTTSEEKPNDIDTLTEFNGYEAEKNNEKDHIEKLISNAKADTKGFCHSFRVYWYPASEKIEYKFYIDTKMRILLDLFGFDRKQIPKGFIHLI